MTVSPFDGITQDQKKNLGSQFLMAFMILNDQDLWFSRVGDTHADICKLEAKIYFLEKRLKQAEDCPCRANKKLKQYFHCSFVVLKNHFVVKENVMEKWLFLVFSFAFVY